jgi:hypothetical protein
MSANVARRHMTVGQRAMVWAMAYPDPEKGGRGKKALGDRTVSRERVSLARVVLEFAPDLADGVLAGTAPLDAAYKTAQDRKSAAMGTEAVSF